jgi:hypothetical protein
MDIFGYIFFWIFSVYYRKLKLIMIKKNIVPICIHLHKKKQLVEFNILKSTPY